MCAAIRQYKNLRVKLDSYGKVYIYIYSVIILMFKIKIAMKPKHFGTISEIIELLI